MQPTLGPKVFPELYRHTWEGWGALMPLLISARHGHIMKGTAPGGNSSRWALHVPPAVSRRCSDQPGGEMKVKGCSTSPSSPMCPEE